MTKPAKTCTTCQRPFRSRAVTTTCRKCAQAKLARYWAGSATASVLADYRAGNVKTVRAD